jgi:NADPH:quinone reductase-like Zn-dependent oxidoreductase
MVAAIYKQYGPPSVLGIEEVQKPIPKDKEVLIRVHATTVNRTDCAMLQAKPAIMRLFTGLLKPSNPILGTDFAGSVEAVGKKVTTFKAGDRVFGLKDSGLSSHAAYMVFSEEEAIAHLPESFTYEQGAASLEGAHYAYNFLNKASIHAGDTVLINGATGAIGSAMVQLVKYLGAEVTAVCSTANMTMVKALGADYLIDYTKEDFTKRPQHYHYVFDAVGKSTFAKCKSLLLPHGVYISSELGPYSQNPFLALLTPLLGGKKVKFPIPTDCKRSVLHIQKLLEMGKFKPVIDRIYPFSEIAEAYTYVEKGMKTGNVIINWS